MAGRPRRSCDSCNHQKLRCSGDKPACHRCRRLKRQCDYRNSASRAQEQQEATSFRSPDLQLLPPTNRARSFPPSNPPEKRSYGLPSALLPVLIDVYFDYLYNAHLLFHRPSFEDSLAAGSLRTDVVLSVCALAGKFYKDVKGTTVLAENHFCRQWAEDASRYSLLEFECPQSENVVSFLNLALYWWSVGQFQRATLHAGSATNTALMLGLPYATIEKEQNLQSELHLRRFWACFMLNVFNGEKLYLKPPTTALLDLRLPHSVSQHRLDVEPDPAITLRSAIATQNIHAELVRALYLWSDVTGLIKRPKQDSFDDSIEFQALDRQLHKAYNSLVPSFQLNCLDGVSSSDLQNILLLHVIYHQCWCSLHASVVPLFSWSASDDVCSYAQQISGQTAWDHANRISALLAAALEIDWDATKMPSFIGYAAYCACAIQMPFLWSTNVNIKQSVSHNVVTNLKVLQLLGAHWDLLRLLAKFAHRLYTVLENKNLSLSDEPKNLPACAMASVRPADSRTRLSILAFNAVLLTKDGDFANDPADLPGVVREDEGLRNVLNQDNGDGIADMISKISTEGSNIPAQAPYSMDLLLPFDRLDAPDIPGILDWSSTGQLCDSSGSSDDWWISELMQ